MQFFRFKDNNYIDLEETELNQLDLKNKRTLFIFPGSENATPAFPPPPGSGAEKKIARLARVLERGVIYTQDAQIATNTRNEPFQVVVATWENFDECMERLKRLQEKPAKYYSEEAKKFNDQLYAQDFDPNKITFLGWSYGTCFTQECANEIRQNRLGRGEKIPPIYNINVATVTNPANNSINGFPGFHVYGWNDKVLDRYTDESTKGLYRFAVAPFAKGYKYHSRVIKPLNRNDHLMLITTGPNHPLRYVRKPRTPNQMQTDRLEDVIYQPRRHSETNKPVFDDETVDQLERAEYCHMPGAYMESLPGTKYIPDRTDPDDRKKVDAWEHTLFFDRCMRNILCRDGPINYHAMLFNHDYCPVTGLDGYDAEHVSRMLANRGAFYAPHVDKEGKLKLTEYNEDLGKLLPGGTKQVSIKSDNVNLRDPNIDQTIEVLKKKMSEQAMAQLRPTGRTIDLSVDPELYMVTDGEHVSIHFHFTVKPHPGLIVNPEEIRRGMKGIEGYHGNWGSTNQ